MINSSRNVSVTILKLNFLELILELVFIKKNLPKSKVYFS